MMFKYKSPIGGFAIKPTMSGRWELQLDDKTLGAFPSPQAAAEAVSVHMTGCPDWDCLFADNIPQCLEDWEFAG